MKHVRKDLRKASSPEKARILQRFFKTGKGQYGEGDIFMGVKIPDIRKIVKESHKRILIKNIDELLSSRIHEERMISLLILIEKYNLAKKQKDEIEKKEIVDFYLEHAKLNHINNWDLVDLTAPKILGNFLVDKKDRKILYSLAKSNNLWERRIAIVSTYAFIRENDFSEALKISKILLKDKHDLMHKAVGWMLREVGKKDVELLKSFLRENYSNLSRTTLRYAIEKFPEDLRKKFLNGDI